MIEDIFLYSFAVATILIMWFNTHAAYEYIKLFRLQKVLGLEEYEQKLEKYGMYLYEYLTSKDDNFVFRLFACPICFSVWINLILSVTTHQSASIFFGTQWVSLFLYLLFKKLL